MCVCVCVCVCLNVCVSVSDFLFLCVYMRARVCLIIGAIVAQIPQSSALHAFAMTALNTTTSTAASESAVTASGPGPVVATLSNVSTPLTTLPAVSSAQSDGGGSGSKFQSLPPV